MANQIAETTQSLTTAAEMRETTMMLMQPDANWEEYLTPAPMSIAILGELVFISSGTDFSISPKDPNQEALKYIKYPDSFRACLMQVCNSGWHAFNEAHKSMDRIRLHTGTVPDYMKASVQILFNAPDEVIAAVLPTQLENIRSIANECKTLADNVEKKYLDVINLIQELLEACVNAKRFHGEELKNVQMKLQELKMRETTTKMEKEHAKKAMDDMAKELEETQDTYKKAMTSLPSGWTVIGMNFVEGLTSSAVGLVNFTLSQMAEKGLGKKSKSSKPTEEYRDENVDQLSEANVCCSSGEIMSYATFLSEHVNGSEIAWGKLYDPQSQTLKTSWHQKQFKRIHQKLSGYPEGELRATAVRLCDMGIFICSTLATYTPERTWGHSETKEITDCIKKFREEAMRFDTVSKKKIKSPALNPQTPMKYKHDKSSSGHKSASQIEVENAHLRIEQSSEQLKQARQLYEQRVDNMAAKQKEMNDILIEMQGCNIKEIDFTTTIKMLVKGLDAMGQVKVQWEKMVLFFQMVASIISVKLNKPLLEFADHSDNLMNLSYDKRLFTKDLVYTQVFQASNVANLVNMISSTYVQVSNKYLMDRMSSLGRLMVMDKDSPKFEFERQELQNSCREAQEGILQLVQQNKIDYERKTKKRMAKIEQGLKAVLPALPPQETKRIKEIVETTFGEDEGNYY